MLRLTELRLPLDHHPEALKAAILARLHLAAAELKHYTIFKRGYDARKKAAIVWVYTLDLELANEAQVLARFASDPHVQKTPNMTYRLVAKAPEHLTERPVIVVWSLWFVGRFSVSTNGL